MATCDSPGRTESGRLSRARSRGPARFRGHVFRGRRDDDDDDDLHNKPLGAARPNWSLVCHFRAADAAGVLSAGAIVSKLRLSRPDHQQPH